MLDAFARHLNEIVAAGATMTAMKLPAVGRELKRRIVPDPDYASIVVAIRKAELHAADGANGEARLHLEWINLSGRSVEISDIGISWWFFNQARLPLPTVEAMPTLLTLPGSSLASMTLMARLFEKDLTSIGNAARAAPNAQSTAVQRLEVTIRFVAKSRLRRNAEVQRVVEVGGLDVRFPNPPTN